LELLFGWLKGIWAIGRWEEPKSPEIPQILALTFYSQEGTLNFIERGNHREVIGLGCEGIPVVEDYQ